MNSVLRWLKKLTAFRIGLATGLFFSLLYVVQFAGRFEIPVLTKLEHALKDVQFAQRGTVQPSGRVVIAAVDDAAIARFGRFPWDRRVIAGLVDKLTAEGAAVIGFDMSFSDQDLGAQFAGAKRFRRRFADASLAEGKGKDAVDRFSEAESDVSGAQSALEALRGKVAPGAEPIYKTAKGRLEDGLKKLSASKDDFDALEKLHEAYAGELDLELSGLDPDQVLAKSIKESGKVVLGWVALTGSEARALKPEDIAAGVASMKKSALAAPVYREIDGAIVRDHPIQSDQLKLYSAASAPLPVIAGAASRFGFFNTLPDADGVIRNTPVAIRVGQTVFGSLETMMMAAALGVRPERVQALTANAEDRGVIDGFSFDDKLYVPTDSRGLLRVNYYGGQGTFTTLSIADIMDGRTPPGALKDKLVFVAATAEATFDQRVTPFDKITAGVNIHANALETMLSRNFLRRDVLTSAAEALFLLVIALAFAFIFSRVRVGLSLPTVLLSSAVIWVLSSAFFRAGIDVYAAMPLIEMGSMFVLVTVFRYATEEKDKRQLRKAFQLYLNPDVMEQMLGQPEKLQLGGDEKDITVMFSDIRGFTTLSEKLTPKALVHFLNEYFTPMTDIVFAKTGTLDKYIGDAVMAFFGAPLENPKNALDACEAALEMMHTLDRLREKWRIEAPDTPHLDIGIGLNSGPMVVGNMGSNQRFNYTVMGDNVNLASRLEGTNKEYGTHILISEATLQRALKAGGPDCLTVRELDLITVKGKQEPVRIFELRGHGKAVGPEAQLIATYAEGLELYRQQRFHQARLSFERCLELEPADGPAELFCRRCDAMAERPPGAGWDGVFKMTHK
jgi:adenylate cyclase